MSAIPFSLSHSALVEIPFCYTNEATFGTLKTASPSYTAVAIVSDIEPTIDNNEIEVRQIGSHLKYGMQSSGHRYRFGVNIHPYDIPFLKYGTSEPNYTTPAGTSAESLQFLLKYKQSNGTAGLNSYFVSFLGCKCNSTTISVASGGLVEASMEWMAREMTVPATTSGLTTPTLPTFASITAPALSNVDAGNTPMTINSVTYPIDEFSCTWNNNLIEDSFVGSGLVDFLTVGAIDVTGSFNTPAGKDLLLDAKIHDFPQTGVTATLVLKTATAVINFTGFKLMSDASPQTSGPTATKKHQFTFSCNSAVLATS